MKRFLSFAAAFAFASAAYSADISVTAITDFVSDVKASIATYDKNGDGLLDREELGDRSWMLMALDKNRDGKLSEEEIRIGVGRFSRTLFPSRPHAPSIELAPMLDVPREPVQGPRFARGADFGVGRRLPDPELQTLDGKPAHWTEFAGPNGTVIAVITPSCPVSQKYLPALARLEKEYAARGVKFLGLSAPGEEAAALKGAGLAGPVLLDPHGDWLRAAGATRSTDVFVIDLARTLVYRGAIDDQYGLGYSLDAPRERFLAPALEALLAGHRPAVSATEAPGCELEIPSAPAVTAAPSTPTWHGRISRIVQAHCAACHRTGGVAPFPFETYAQVLKKAGTIQRVVKDGVMPPWLAPAPAPGHHTLWLNDASLTPEDKSDLLAWLANGRPEGDPNEAARPEVWRDGWSIGEPDLIVQLPKPIDIKAEGTMPYQSIMVDSGLTENKWVTAWEVRPTAPAHVHHALVYIYDPAEWNIPGTEERKGHLADYTPGSSYSMYPEGYAKALPKAAKFRFEIHYTPNGKPAQDQMMLGLRFASRPPAHVVEIAGVANVALQIPPGVSFHPIGAAFQMPDDARLISLTPHMHVRGKAMRFEVIAPDGQIRTLLDLPRYDFNWQIPTQYAEPPFVKKGSLIRVTGWFDNSVENKANPNPNATVRWGSQTDDEMMIGYVEFTRVK